MRQLAMPQRVMRTMLASSRISIVPAATAGTAGAEKPLGTPDLMTEVAAAEALILAHMPRFPARHEPLAACTGRVLAEDIHAERDQPPFDRVTMDGVAIAFRDWAEGVRSFQVLGTQAAGAEPLAVATSAQCVEVMTGTAAAARRRHRRAGRARPAQRHDRRRSTPTRRSKPSNSFIAAAAIARPAASYCAPGPG